MGYSCTRDAANMLGVIGHFYATDGNPNILTIGKDTYFFERGKEQEDGAITGSLYLCLPDDMARKVGGVKINPDGTIERFPRMRSVELAEITATYYDMSARNPQLLSAWASGRI